MREMRGSSPLTRGKQHVRRDVDRVLRLIPAHAGKTLLTKYPSPNLTAHPRSRGENTHRHLREAAFNGSSPLTRGKLVRRHGEGSRRRLIPAHAGKT